MRLANCTKCRKIITLKLRKYLCKDCANTYRKQWREKNRAWCLFKSRSKRLKNRDKVNEYFRNYYNHNKEKLLSGQRLAYRIKKIGVKPEMKGWEVGMLKMKLIKEEKDNFYKAFENWIQP